MRRHVGALRPVHGAGARHRRPCPLWKTTCGHFFEPSNHLFPRAEELIDALCKLGRVDDAVLQFKQMINEGVTPDNVVFNSIVYGLCTVDKWEKVENYFSKC